MLLKVVTLSGCQRASARLTSGMNQVDIQEASNLPIEINSTALDTSPEQRTLAHSENRSCQSQTIRVDEAPNADAVADLHLCHDSLFRTIVRRASKIIHSWALLRQRIFDSRQANDTGLYIVLRLQRNPIGLIQVMEETLLANFDRTITFADVNDAGVLIAFEGHDGSGKTTQRKLFKSWLRSMGGDVAVTKWNSSPLYKPMIKARKAARSLDPESYASLHAADFRHRYENVINPALAGGQIVIADRYIFTGIARDVARGMNRDCSLELYSGFRKPDLVFYFRAPLDICAQRIAASREIKFYEAGQDITGLDDPYESYLRFGSRVVSEYDHLHRQVGFVVVNAERPIYEQHRFIREAYLQEFARPVLSEFECQLDAVPIPS